MGERTVRIYDNLADTFAAAIMVHSAGGAADAVVVLDAIAAIIGDMWDAAADSATRARIAQHLASALNAHIPGLSAEVSQRIKSAAGEVTH